MDALNKHWYRVKDLRLGLRSHVDIHRHTYRGRIWYVVQDHVSGRFFRFSPDAYRYIGQLNGEKTLDEIWLEEAANRSNEQQVDQEVEQAQMLGTDQGAAQQTTKGDLIRLLSQFYRADLLIGDVMPDTRELINRSQTLQEKQRAQKFRSPIAVRVPLFDPNRFLNATWPVMRHLFSWKGFVLWLFAMVYGGIVLTTHWQEFSTDVFGKALSTSNILLLIVLFPVVKFLHEFGHAYVIKAMRGEVHEMGVIFLIFMPVMYVDASSSSSNKNKYERALVGAAGMFIELFVAVIALVVWSQAEPGLIKAIAYNVVLIAGVSTLFFNANPLVRFDGYYILSDLIEIPNLASRSTQYVAYLYQKSILRLPNVTAPDTAPGESKWLVFYAIAAFFYRLFIIVAILSILIDQYFFFGVIMAIWAFVLMVVAPVYKGLAYLFQSNRLQGYRSRAILNTGLLIALLAGLFSIPIPFSVISEGVIWVDRQAWVRNQTEGFVQEFDVQVQAPVTTGQRIAQLNNQTFTAQLQRLKLSLDELYAQYDALKQVDRVQANLIQNQIQTLQNRLLEFQARERELTIESQFDGQFIRVTHDDMKDTFLPKGSLLGFVAGDDQTIVRVVIQQADIGLIRNELQRIEVRFADDIQQVVSADILREIPSASQTLPSLALSSEGGGRIVLDPASGASSDPSSFQSFFQIDLKIHEQFESVRYGGRVYAKFAFKKRSLFAQIYRPLKQTFLSKLV
ncbi:MAG: peptidase M50 [Arenicella sp.]